MTPLLLTIRDITHGGAMDPDGIVALSCLLLGGAMMAVLFVSIWRHNNKEQP